MKKKINWKRQLWGNGITLAIVLLIIGGIWYRVNHQNDTWKQVTADKTVVIGLDDTYVPMGFRDKSGKLVGYDVDLARETFKRLGLKVKFQPIDWSMNVTELDTGHIDMIWNGFTITPQRAKQVAFSVPYHFDTQVLVTMTSNGIDHVDQMKGQTLGVQSGSSGFTEFTQYPKLLKNKMGQSGSVVQYDTFDKALNDLQVGRVKAVLIDSDYARYFVAHEKNPADFKIVKTDFPKDQYGVGFRKGDATLRKEVNSELLKMKKDGTIDQISEKYFGTPNAQ
jgi:polar amino acid transport system substrate-binding protein